MDWLCKLKLNNGEKLIFDKQCNTGHLGQEERKYYKVINESGDIIGRVRYIEHTDTNNPNNISFSLQQSDIENNVITFERW